ncbi:MAG: hypothetical protein QMD88_05490 [Coprothermobacterota bacterium]|nr:hypothetical protein [Coprothermobacterota bacterium]
MNERTPLAVKFVLITALLICALLLGFLLKDYFPVKLEEPPQFNPPSLDITAIQGEVSNLRQLPLKEEIPAGFLDKEALNQALKESMEDELSQQDLQSTEKVLRFLGILEGGQSLKEVLLEVLSEQVYGFYDHESGELKVLKKEDKTTALERLALVHEVVHGIQDQNFDLSRFIPPDFKGSDDELMAVQSLYEGDASWTSVLYVQKNSSLSFGLGLLLDSLDLNQSALELAPPYVVESLLFPYQEGMTFVKTLYEKGGWMFVNQAFEKPPVSTEQILHPEKYLSNEQPATITFPEWKSLEGFTLVRDNALGEFDFRFLFRSVLPENQALVASTGWNGSRYQLWEKEGMMVFILESRWDSPQDASEAEFALENFLKSRFGFAPTNYYRGSLYVGGNEVGLLYPSGQAQYLILAPDEELALNILSELP